MTERDEPYTPSLDEAREAWLYAEYMMPDARALERVATPLEERGAEFDRMIEAVRAEEREKAIQIAQETPAFEPDGYGGTRWLTCREAHARIAERIREQGS